MFRKKKEFNNKISKLIHGNETIICVALTLCGGGGCTCISRWLKSRWIGPWMKSRHHLLMFVLLHLLFSTSPPYESVEGVGRATVPEMTLVAI